MVLMGCWAIDVKDNYFDYTPYLGPDWKKTISYGKAGSIVANHQSWIDILVHMYRQIPSHTAKTATLYLPFIGYISECAGCLFLDRDGSKEEKKNTIKQIIERQKECEKGIYPPLIQYVEGGTTNGRELIQFKKGAFVGLHSVQPVIVQYKSALIDIDQCAIPIYSHMMLLACNPYCSIKVIELPDFFPNEYFWKHHQKEGEEQWQTYARVIREIMAKKGGYKLSDLSIEDKFEYRS